MAKTILVVDDEEIITKTFAKLLKKQGYEVLVAGKGEEALLLAEKNPFDLILSDIRMPGMNGVVTVRHLRKIAQNKGIPYAPVVFVTGFADEKLEEEAQALSPVAFIYKPFDAMKLLEMIREALEKASNSR